MIDLWLEPLTLAAHPYQFYWQLLNISEQQKALTFIQARHRQFYVICHAKLRLILADYLNQAPTDIEFAIQDFGKPVIANKHQGVYFNLSHSGDYMLIAVGNHADIGVDIEIWNHQVDYAAIVSLCFSIQEQNYWRQLSPTRQPAFFFQRWARKESFIKAIGTGLNTNVAEIDSSLTGQARFLDLPQGYGDSEYWQLLDLNVRPGFSAALTAPSHSFNQIQFKTLTA